VPVDALGTRDEVTVRCIEALVTRGPELFRSIAGIIMQHA
jgi:hypothetical protein